jgi:CRP-like cAMP-binding protein
VIENLRQFEAFANLDWTALMTVARHTRQMRIPANRWLIRPGQVLEDAFYLLRGRVKTYAPDGIVNARTCRTAVYPGVDGVLTMSRCEWLRVDTSPIAFLLEGGAAAAEQQSDSDEWQIRFLRSHMMSQLAPAVWQRILGDLQPRECLPGELIIEYGAPADCSYIMASGRARVHLGKRALRELSPGDFFGEDALLCGGPRNASVTMVEGGCVMKLERDCFQNWLEKLLVHAEGGYPARRSSGAQQLINTPDLAGLRRRELRVPGWEAVANVRGLLEDLDPACSYVVRGDVPGICAMTVFLLRQRGIRAWVGEWTATADLL